MGNWISVSDRVPEQGHYLFATKTVGVRCGFLSGYAAKYKRPEALIDGSGRQFTHWMPIPEPPQED
tara:strand:+ start:3662 stop:3859 length:198 start_codon:yes stop_codon:yes gene_type:complete